MNIFKRKNEDLYLVTNLKVMYSTLKAQESIEEIPKSFSLVLKIIFNNLNLTQAVFFLLVRNPYHRLESFFKNKFRTTLPRIQRSGEWQPCHEIFFPHLELRKSPNPTLVIEKLSGINFTKFISLLPLVYTKDGHLYPQNWARHLHIRYNKYRVGIPIKYKEVFKMESEKDLNKMAKLFMLDLEIRENSTQSVNEQLDWTEKEYNIVNELYKYDFKYYKY